MKSIAVIWAQFGPYHFARVAGLRAVAGTTKVHAIELSNRSEDYSWQRGENCSRLHTLFSGKASERLGFQQVFLHTRRKLAELQPEVCFLPSYWPKQSLAALLAARSLRVRTVMMNESHAGTARASGPTAQFKRKLLQLFDAGLVGGRPHKRYFESLGVNSQKIFTGYDAVDNDYFASCAQTSRTNEAKLRESYQLPTRYFLNVGRFVAKKNLRALVIAYHKYLQSGPSKECHLVLVGSGPEETPLKCLCHELGLSVYQKTQIGRLSATSQVVVSPQRAVRPGIHFYGFRQIEESPIFYGLAEAFILPSRYEEWGLVVNEAMACGLPVVVSETAGCSEDLLESAEANAPTLPSYYRGNGFVFAPDCCDGLAHILNILDSEQAVRRAMGRQSRRLVERFSCGNFGRNAMAAARCALGIGDSTVTHVKVTSPLSLSKA